jgi:anti-sigma regulatory factor (Ser/Thr protein kinase)
MRPPTRRVGSHVAGRWGFAPNGYAAVRPEHRVHPDHLPDHVDLVLPALPESVARARVATGELARRLGLSERDVDDVRLAVTEAAANAVRHAYAPGARGELEIRAHAVDGALEVVVVDHGRGVATAARVGTADGLGIGMGLPLMRTLAADVRVAETPGGGCTVTLRFPWRAEHGAGGVSPAPSR